jgi:hypothetical protein
MHRNAKLITIGKNQTRKTSKQLGQAQTPHKSSSGSKVKGKGQETPLAGHLHQSSPVVTTPTQNYFTNHRKQTSEQNKQTVRTSSDPALVLKWVGRKGQETPLAGNLHHSSPVINTSSQNYL